MEKVKLTKNELILLKKRLKTYERLHKILKDQYELLIKKFLDEVKKLKSLEKRYNESLINLKSNISLINSLISEKIDEFIKLDVEINYNIDKENVYGVNYLKGKINIELKNKEYIIRTPTINTIESNLENFVVILFDMAITKENIKNLGEQIKELKKRINLLEKRVIPRIKENIKIIKERLDDIEREEKTKLIFLKDKILHNGL